MLEFCQRKVSRWRRIAFVSDKSASIDLDEFVKATIMQIVQGVHAAGVGVPAIDSSAVVNPRDLKDHYKEPTKLHFDVAVTVSGRSGAEVGAKVKVLSAFRAGGKGENVHEHETVSRVQFEVPIALPSTSAEQREPQPLPGVWRGRASPLASL